MKRPLRILGFLVSAGTLLSSDLLLPPRPIQAQSFEGFEGCPAGTREGSTNFITNGNFSTNANTGNGVYTGIAAVPPLLGFSSVLPYRGDAVYPNDPIGGLSIQNGPYPLNYANGVVRADPFPGDPTYGIAASNTFLYSNPAQQVNGNTAFPGPIIWQQVVSGLTPNTTYTFSAYFYNLLAIGAPGAAPLIRFLAGPPGGANTAFVPTVGGFPVGDGTAQPGVPANQNVRQRWVRVQGVFRTAAGQNSMELRIQDDANTITGDDFGVTAVGLRECVPIFGVAKQAGTPVPNANGSFTIPYTVTVRNYAPAGASQYDLTNLQLTDNLGSAFVGATINAVTNLQSPTLTVNPGFNGVSNQNLLAAGNILAAGTTAIATFNVTVTPGTGPNGFGPFQNSALGSAVSRGGVPVNDRSTNGTNPDPAGTLTPNGANVPTPVSLIPLGSGQAAFHLVKRITNVFRDGKPLETINFNVFVDVPGGEDNLPGWGQLAPQRAPIGLPSISVNTPLQSGDEVEYTIYFLSDGTSPAIAVNLCDQFATGVQFVPGSSQVSLANALLIPGGTAYSPLAPLPTDNSCPNQTNPNGAILFNLGTISNTAGNNVGYVRFRARIE